MSRPLALLAACVLAALPLAAAGCAGDDVDPNALAEAAEATRRQGGVHMTATGTVETLGQKVPLKMEGDADLKDMRMHSKLSMGEALPAVEQYLIGTVMYMKMEGLEDALGAEWVKFDLDAIGEDMGVDFGQMLQLSQGSPAEQLEYLRATAGLEEVGKEDVDGVETTHYKGEVDLRKYPDTLPEADREDARRSVDKLIEMSGESTYPTEVWIDEDGLVRRQTMTMDQKKPTAMKMHMDIRYTDFGKDVDIVAPKGARDITALAKEGVVGG